MVVKSKGIPSKMAETIRLRIYKLPRNMESTRTFSRSFFHSSALKAEWCLLAKDPASFWGPVCRFSGWLVLLNFQGVAVNLWWPPDSCSSMLWLWLISCFACHGFLCFLFPHPRCFFIAIKQRGPAFCVFQSLSQHLMQLTKKHYK